MNDTGWVPITLRSGYQSDAGNYGEPQYRIIDSVAYFRGAVFKTSGNFAVNAVFADIPSFFDVMAIRDNEYTGRNLRIPSAFGATLNFLCIQVGVRTIPELRIDALGAVTNVVYLAGITFPIN